MSSTRAWSVLFTTAVFFALIPSRSDAQSQPRQISSLQVPLEFNFVNPGAKSLAMAGAFAGVADDATASFANPAGLTFLDSMEASVEFRGSGTTSKFLQAGRLSGPLSNIGTDTVAGPVFADSTDRHAGVSYASFVYPHKSNQWVIAGYRHELARVDQSYFYQGAYTQDVTHFTSTRDVPQDATRELAITGYGIAGAYKVTRALSVGGALVVYQFDFNSEFRRYFTIPFYDLPNRSVPIQGLYDYSAQTGSSVRLAPVVGATFDRGRLRLGAVYHHGASFDFDVESPFSASYSATFDVPHTFGVGASMRLSAPWLVAGEVKHVSYSRLDKGYVASQAVGFEDNFTIESGTEVHGSVQYAWRRSQGPPIRLRAGAWYDPDHSVKYTPLTPDTPAARTINETTGAGLSTGTSQVHVTGGVGWTITPQFELNVGGDFAERGNTVSTSLIVHFGGTP